MSFNKIIAWMGYTNSVWTFSQVMVWESENISKNYFDKWRADLSKTDFCSFSSQLGLCLVRVKLEGKKWERENLIRKEFLCVFSWVKKKREKENLRWKNWWVPLPFFFPFQFEKNLDRNTTCPSVLSIRPSAPKSCNLCTQPLHAVARASL